jgi:hypothetical protein
VIAPLSCGRASAQVVTPIPGVATPSQAPKSFSQTIQGAPTASLPLNQNDYIPLVQGGAIKKIAASTLGTQVVFSAEPANVALFGPSSGGPAAPTFRAMTFTDLPPLPGNSTFANVGASPATPTTLKFGGEFNTASQTLTIAPSAITPGMLQPGVAAGNVGTLGGDLSNTLPNPRVVQIQGESFSTQAPMQGQVPTWNASMGQWVPAAQTGGITQLTGAVQAGPGSGVVVASLAPSGVAAGSYTLGSNCVQIAATGQITGIIPGSCAVTATYVLLNAGGHISLNIGGSLLTNGS